MVEGSVTIADGSVLATTPCCLFAVAVPIDRLHVLAEAEVRCGTCRKRWDLRFDPWTPGRDAVWCD